MFTVFSPVRTKSVVPHYNANTIVTYENCSHLLTLHPLKGEITIWSFNPDMNQRPPMDTEELMDISISNNNANIDDILIEEEMNDIPNPASPSIDADITDEDISRLIGDGGENSNTTSFEWQILESDVNDLQRTYGRRLPCIATEVLKRALQEVEDLQNRVQHEFLRLSRNTQSEQQRFLLERRPILRTTMRKLRDSLIAEIARRAETSASVNISTPSSANNVKLPKLEIPSFDGKADSWINFKTQYVASIHNNEKITFGEKFRYLNSLLQGEPANFIRHLPTNDGNYEEAWRILVDYYDNPLILLQHHVEQLLFCTNVKREGRNGCSLRELYSNFKQHLAGIRTLERENPNLDPASTAYIYLFLNKCPPAIKSEFRREVRKNTNLATTEYEFFNFIQSLVHAEIEPEKEKPSKGKIFAALPVVNGENRFCLHCKKKANHFLSSCPVFKSLAVDERCASARRLRVCYNCLRKKCGPQCSKMKCAQCQRRHNTILHNDNFVKRNADTQQGNTNFSYLNVLKILKLTSNEQTHSLLATVILKIQNGSKVQKIRALLDSGSQKSFLTKKICKALKFPTSPSSCLLESINNLRTSVLRQTQVEIASQVSNYTRIIEVLILDKIVNNLPSNFFPIDSWKIPENLNLADSTFNIPSDIDMLLGSEIFWEILGERRINIQNSYQLRETLLGWIVVGQLKLLPNRFSNNILSVTPICELTSLLEKFWKIEECPTENKMTELQRTVEQQFVQTTTRNSDGRFIVCFPWKHNPSELGNSRNLALSRFFSLERKLEENVSLRTQYNKCINDWEKLGHMKQIQEIPDENAYYIPHHAVIKETSTSTKLRVVFDASMKTSNGTSLNGFLLVGPVVQPELISTLIRFRMKPYAISADITKMYRQILMHPNDTRFQRIFWRNSPAEPLRVYELLTVAFGTASAPYLATRCIKQLGLEVRNQYPQVSSTLLNDFYVDDCLTGGESLEEVQRLRQQLTEILCKAGFPLTKWCASHKALLQDVPQKDIETEFPFSTDGEPTIKTLGIFWRPGEDLLQFYFRPTKHLSAATKREILAVIASIYDPLGFVGPVTTIAKILMQNIWKLMTADKKSSWDEQLPENLLSSWSLLAEQLSCLKQVKIPRYYFICKPSAVELHGFCDASEKAYAAVIYIRGIPAVTQNVKLVISKSRVAPLKQLSIPRLELSGALLLAQLACKVKEMLQLQYEISLCRLWCDSTIALSWIHTASHKLETFVANRVQKIQNLSKDVIWDHVASNSNPADPLSRGLSPQDLLNCELWWNGPNWLTDFEGHWPKKSNFTLDSDFEIGFKKSELFKVNPIFERNDIFSKFSDFTKLVRVVAYILRFSKGKNRLSGPLQLCELNESKILLIKLAQKEHFSSEIQILQEKPTQNLESTNQLSKNSSIWSLSPFLDEEGVLRVGGRLENATLSFEQKHPIILHPQHPLSNLIVRYEHLTHLHAGPRLLKSILRRNYWILRHHDIVQKCIRQCLKCIKIRAKLLDQSMASLHKSRVIPSRPFEITGIDYSGPVTVRCVCGTKKPIYFKAYIAIFICFSTKAIHLEVVGNLSTLAFLSALNRFISRRGKPSEIHSDNGSAFLGTKALLDKQFRQFLHENKDKIINFASKQEILWHFLPAYTPHWGGLWESNIKSMKSHLKRATSISNALNFDELQTLLIQIEAILNSRPLTPESSDPNDINALTPGHFLIGGPLTALPNSDFKAKPNNQLKNWRLIQNQIKSFWKRWSNDYLNTLNQKTKWIITKNNLKIGDFVLIKEKDLPPMNWCMGKVTQIHPGKDRLIRVVDVCTKNGILTRSISNLVYLPINN